MVMRKDSGVLVSLLLQWMDDMNGSVPAPLTSSVVAFISVLALCFGCLFVFKFIAELLNVHDSAALFSGSEAEDGIPVLNEYAASGLVVLWMATTCVGLVYSSRQKFNSKEILKPETKVVSPESFTVSASTQIKSKPKTQDNKVNKAAPKDAKVVKSSPSVSTAKAQVSLQRPKSPKTKTQSPDSSKTTKTAANKERRGSVQNKDVDKSKTAIKVVVPEVANEPVQSVKSRQTGKEKLRKKPTRTQSAEVAGEFKQVHGKISPSRPRKKHNVKEKGRSVRVQNATRHNSRAETLLSPQRAADVQSRASRSNSFPQKQAWGGQMQRKTPIGQSAARPRGYSSSFYQASYTPHFQVQSEHQEGKCANNGYLFNFLRAIGMEIYYGMLSSKDIAFSRIVVMTEQEFESSFELPFYAKQRIWTGLEQLRHENNNKQLAASRNDRPYASLFHSPEPSIVHNRLAKASSKVTVDINMSQLEALALGMSRTVLDLE